MKCKNCPALKNIIEGIVIVESYCEVTVNKCELGLEFKSDTDGCNRNIEEINAFINNEENEA